MKQVIRGVKGVLTACGVGALGLGLCWVTAGSVGAANSEDLASMAGVAVGAVGWMAYCWLVVAALATALEQAPGAIGRSASVIADWITSHSSRALLRSALGFAAVSPLTIAAAHAAPSESGPQHSVQRTSSAWAEVEKAPVVQLGPSLGQEQVPGQDGVPGQDRVRGSSQGHVRSQAQARAQAHGRWTDVEPRSVVQLTGITLDEWRSVEQPSRAGVIPDRQRPEQHLAEQRAASQQRAEQQHGSAEQRRTDQRPVDQLPTTPVQSPGPEKRRAEQRPAVGPAERLGVPDRPTDGAPTRYTDLGSGREMRPVQPTRSPRHHVVRRGDSLWAIAAAELGPGAPDAAVAARWPQWYAANNAVIGPDPELLLPGQVLRAPSHPPNPTLSRT